MALFWQRNILFGAICVSVFFGFCGFAQGGDKFSSQGNALYKALLDELIKGGICTDNQSCFDALQMYREDGDRIYMNMYAQTDNSLSAIVAKFIMENGLRITGGMPITLRIYVEPKSQHLGWKSVFGINQEAVKLEVGK